MYRMSAPCPVLDAGSLMASLKVNIAARDGLLRVDQSAFTPSGSIFDSLYEDRRRPPPAYSSTRGFSRVLYERNAAPRDEDKKGREARRMLNFLRDDLTFRHLRNAFWGIIRDPSVINYTRSCKGRLENYLSLFFFLFLGKHILCDICQISSN